MPRFSDANIMTHMISADILNRLKDIVGPKGWVPGDDAARYFADPRGRFTGQGCLVLKPRTTRQVSQIIRCCDEAGALVVPYGGGTGVVAGQLSIENPNAIILSLEAMNTIRAVLPDDGCLIAEAGCILQDIHQVAADHDMCFPLSMGSKGSCTIGGNLATNAGGIQVVRHGNARDLCLGIEAVLPSGEIYSGLAPLRKDNTGYDLRHLLIGSEGTLGIITAATLTLEPADAETATALCALDTPGAALAVLRALRRDLGPGLSAIELISRLGMALVTNRFETLANPIKGDHDWYLLIDAGGPPGIRDRLEHSLSEALDTSMLQDAVLASSDTQREALWKLREFMPEANRDAGAFCNSDTSVPISQIGPFIAQTTAALCDLHADLRINSYGHIGDGNIHHNVLPPEGWTKPQFIAAHPDIIETARQAINDVTLQLGGSISAEHGIGRLKPDDLARHSATKRHVLQQIKHALDPKGTLNPGALIR